MGPRKRKADPWICLEINVGATGKKNPSVWLRRADVVAVETAAPGCIVNTAGRQWHVVASAEAVMKMIKEGQAAPPSPV